ncbi:MAG: cytochrome c oxidase subunit II [Candidatus Sumerlaeota bacterium]|nr:cytochrome c oxidase subunit II [Candidatus Sumerlaeota bacterium]
MIAHAADLATSGSLIPERPLFGSSLWLPPPASTAAIEVDWVFQFIFWIDAFFFVLVTALMILFLWRYARPRGARAVGGPTHSTPLEITWTVVPLFIVMAIFYEGFRTYMESAVTPGNGYDVQVTGQQWKWMFTYPNGYVDENLHVPVGRPIRLTLTSSDVIHSLYIPAFRLKKDAVPGRFNKEWFQATQPGEYQIFCAEYCGTGHSDMLAKAIVHPPGEFENWLENAASYASRLSPAEAGEKIYHIRGCAQCHSLDGTAGTGPSFKGLWGSTVTMSDGLKVVVDENYVRESILQPQAKVVAGFQPVMPTFQSRLKDQDILDVIEFLKTLAPGR